jgi:hypothetical protein
MTIDRASSRLSSGMGNVDIVEIASAAHARSDEGKHGISCRSTTDVHTRAICS